MSQQEELPEPFPELGSTPKLLAWAHRMRNRNPVFFDEKMKSWHVLRYEDVARVQSDSKNFSSALHRVLPLGDPGRGNPALLDPPEHRLVRTLVSRAFTPQSVRQLVARITAVTEQLLDTMADHDEADLVAALCYPLPVTIISELLGIPTADHDMVRRWADVRLSVPFDRPIDESTEHALQACAAEQNNYLAAHVRHRRRHPREDLISRLTLAEVEGDRLSDEEIVRFAGFLFLAGHVTTSLLLANAVVCLGERPAAAATLRTDPTSIPGAIEEILRCRPPAPFNTRVTTRDVELHGHILAEGSLVTAWILSANHDELQFPDPDRFDIGRTPNPHLGFGHGAHFCLGAPLARLEVRIALRLLLNRFPRFEVGPGARTHEGSGLSLIRVLPVSLRA
ncbi:cytochrome P450 [Nocardia terpenica]|uniref:Cytochrome P450 n=1 Tax=Nocardia terpenica TaxID=455432 RepID=A0A6G9Z8E6_9NOCA|nr:cytochrome P450 [Nocardia terpenica]QIS21627.1 cytochrome P450 [Nocardia terpenica]